MADPKTMTKKDKVIIVLIAILAIGFLIQTTYLVKLHNKINAASTSQITVPTDSHSSLVRRKSLFDKGFDRWDPFEEMERMQREINKMFRNSLWRGGLDFGFGSLKDRTSFFEPNADIQEKKDYYVLTFDIPGMEKDKIDVSIENGYITVQGERNIEREEESKDGRIFRTERSYGNFYRSLPLPGEVKEDEITAEYKNGVLTVTLPKVTPGMSQEVKAKKVSIL